MRVTDRFKDQFPFEQSDWLQSRLHMQSTAIQIGGYMRSDTLTKLCR